MVAGMGHRVDLPILLLRENSSQPSIRLQHKALGEI
jgi:hypothetical protein